MLKRILMLSGKWYLSKPSDTKTSSLLHHKKILENVLNEELRFISLLLDKNNFQNFQLQGSHRICEEDVLLRIIEKEVLRINELNPTLVQKELYMLLFIIDNSTVKAMQKTRSAYSNVSQNSNLTEMGPSIIRTP